MTVGLNTAAAGNVNGTVVVNFASDGTGTSGLGITALPSQSVGVTGVIQASGSIFRLASASAAPPNPVDFGNVRIGSVATQSLTITNSAPNDGFSERLNASIGGATAGVTAAGSFNLLAPAGHQQRQPRRRHRHHQRRARAAARATIALASDGTGTSGLGVTALPSQTVAVNGAVYRLANPTLVPSSLDARGARRRRRAGRRARASPTSRPTPSPSGSTRASARVSARIRRLRLDHRLAAVRPATRSASSLNTASAGSFAGTAGVSFVSSGAGTTGAADLALPGQSVALTGHVYTPAWRSEHHVVDFGIVHRGDAVPSAPSR